MTVREWLRANNYSDVADLIDEVIAEFAVTGSKERRNWTDVLCGGKDGESIVVSGQKFPVLASAQRSRNRPVTPKAIQRNKDEEFPAPRVTGRWPKKTRLPKKAKRPTRKASRSDHARAS